MAKRKAIDLDQFFSPPAESDDLAFLIGAAPEEAAERAKERGLPLLHLPVETIAPDPHQLRHLPHPAELARLAEAGDRAAGAIVAGLRELGRSMADHGQIQPVIVYAAADPENPAITHRLLNGHRRWSAAVLVDLPSVWAVEVPPPTDVVRLLHQFEENERREGFSDMERAWALIALKDALQAEAGGEVPWGVVEEQLQLSTARRQDLLRLLRFSPEGQALVMRYGWPEWTLRPLHMAISAGALDQNEAVDMLRVLAEREEVNKPVVEALVEGYCRQKVQEVQPAAPNHQSSEQELVLHNEVADIAKRMARLRRTIEQLRTRMGAVRDDGARQTWRAEAAQLRQSLEALAREL